MLVLVLAAHVTPWRVGANDKITSDTYGKALSTCAFFAQNRSENQICRTSTRGTNKVLRKMSKNRSQMGQRFTFVSKLYTITSKTIIRLISLEDLRFVPSIKTWILPNEIVRRASVAHVHSEQAGFTVSADCFLTHGLKSSSGGPSSANLLCFHSGNAYLPEQYKNFRNFDRQQ